jgi:hypothetical protein
VYGRIGIRHASAPKSSTSIGAYGLRCATSHKRRIRGQPPAVNDGGYLLAVDRWKAEGLGRIVVNGGYGAA